MLLAASSTRAQAEQPRAAANRFFFNPTSTTQIYTLSLHDALPISLCIARRSQLHRSASSSAASPSIAESRSPAIRAARDRKSTRLNSSHSSISYAVFCLKKKKGRHLKRQVGVVCSRVGRVGDRGVG